MRRAAWRRRENRPLMVLLFVLAAVAGSIPATHGGAVPGVLTLEVGGVPDPVVAGTLSSVTVTAKNATGEVDTTYSGTISFRSSDVNATLPPQYTFVAEDAGTHTFTDAVILRTLGEQSVTADEQPPNSFENVHRITRAVGLGNVYPASSGSQVGITVIAPPQRPTLVVSTIADPTTAGAANTVSVKAIDGDGNVDPTYRGTVRFMSSDAAAVVPGEYTFTETDAGVRRFTGRVTLRTAGEHSVTAIDTNSASVNGAQTFITVTPWEASALIVAGVPDPTKREAASSVTVAAIDPSGNIATGYRGTVRFTSSDPAAALPPDYTFTAGDAGIHTFDGIELRSGGEHTIRATDTVTHTITGAQAEITVNP